MEAERYPTPEVSAEEIQAQLTDFVDTTAEALAERVRKNDFYELEARNIHDYLAQKMDRLSAGLITDANFDGVPEVIAEWSGMAITAAQYGNSEASERVIKGAAEAIENAIAEKGLIHEAEVTEFPPQVVIE